MAVERFAELELVTALERVVELEELRVALLEELRVAEEDELVPVDRFTCAAPERCWVEEERTAEELLLDEELPEEAVLRVAVDELPLRRV